ncbi:hypothetical protein GcM1_219032 [Golovinomyces cichoracearum]|uniref:Uncharacterized protein n=1 Tax=Golovinomyces cichoracearum TaxID=62708 RepID=A0A420ISC5_9PEZI|nr:hypothetical protein GcM1_219032 [Golovinomyces cichoracearum]
MPFIHKREEFSEDCNVQKIQRPIDVTAEINVENIDAYANWWIEWNDHRYRDEELCETFCEDFGEWSEDHWKACSPQIRRKLQDMLRRNGVFIQKRNIKADKALKELATSEYFFPEWTTQEIMHQFLHHALETGGKDILERN